MKKSFTRKFFLLSLIAIEAFTTNIYNAHATALDPGAGRLSGQYVSDDFYDTLSGDNSLTQYGATSNVSPYTKASYTHQDVFDTKTIINGIDVSQWQKTIDWTKVKAAGIDYAFIRAGYRSYGVNSTGTIGADTNYKTNIENATAAGINTGVYIFSQAITVEEAQAEAKYLLENISAYSVTMPLVIDFEYAANNNGSTGRLYEAKLSKEAATDICMAFCKVVEDAGYVPMVYANKTMLTNNLNAATISAKYPIWLANYTTNTTYTGSFQFWQYADNGKVDGISGNVDMNFFYATDPNNYIFTADNRPSIASATITEITNQPYTGSAVTPPVTISYNGKALVNGQDYAIKYENNINYGKATITITGLGHFKGTKTIDFNIVPPNVSGFKAQKITTTTISLKWSKCSSAKGYQIYYATSPNGVFKKLTTISKNSTTTYKHTGLTEGTCYYYQIRTYKKVGSTTHYGNFTKTKNIYTKPSYTKNIVLSASIPIYNNMTENKQIVTTVPANAEGEVTVLYTTADAEENNWYYVRYLMYNTAAEYYGYIPCEGLTYTSPGKVVTNLVNVRKSYKTTSKILTTLKRNEEVTVLSTKKKKGVTWYKVTFETDDESITGWISAPFLKRIVEEE